MLEINSLTVSIDGKELLNNVNLYINKGETVVLFGPNGSGKTSLLKTIIGMSGYKVKHGQIIFKGNNITKLTIDERARSGIGIAFQRPPAVRGVKLMDLLNIYIKESGDSEKDKISDSADRLKLSNLMERDINLGFSGGEIKRSEILQLIAQDPDLLLLDEPDSGVDLESINLLGKIINELLEKDKMAVRRKKAGLIITHSGYILDYINADRAYVMFDGSIGCTGNPRDILDDIRSKGFAGCIKCQR